MRFFTLLTLAVPAISAAFAEASPVDLAPSLVERSPLEKRIALSNTQLCINVGPATLSATLSLPLIGNLLSVPLNFGLLIPLGTCVCAATVGGVPTITSGGLLTTDVSANFDAVVDILALLDRATALQSVTALLNAQLLNVVQVALGPVNCVYPTGSIQDSTCGDTCGFTCPSPLVINQSNTACVVTASQFTKRSLKRYNKSASWIAKRNVSPRRAAALAVKRAAVPPVV